MLNKTSLLFVGLITLSGIAYSLVSAASEFLPYAQTLADNGIINAQSSEAGYFLSENLLRAQAVKLSLGTVGLGQRDCRNLSSLTFSDVTTSMGDLCGYIEGAITNNIITKTNGFYPYQPISRSNFADLIVKAFDASVPGLITKTSLSDNYFSDVPAGLYNATSINRLATTNCINVGGIFRPSDYITRGESFKIMACLLGKKNGFAAITNISTSSQSTNSNQNTSFSNSSNTSTTAVPGFPWTIQGVNYTNLNDIKTKYPGSCVYINGVYAVMGFGPCVSGTSTNTSSSNTSTNPNTTNNNNTQNPTASVPADCGTLPDNYKIVKPGESVYGGRWNPASSATTFVGQLPAGAGVALELPVNTSTYPGGFKVVDSTGGSKSYVISRCPGSTVPVDGQDGTVDKNGDGKKDKCKGMNVYARWVNTSGTTPNYFSGISSYETSCFLSTTSNLGSSTSATYYINILNTSSTNPVGIQYANYAQLGTLPAPLGTISSSSSNGTSPSSSNNQNQNTTSTTAVPGFPWTIQGVSYTNLADVKAKYPGSCVYINGHYAVMGFGPCISGTSTNTSSSNTNTNSNSTNTNTQNPTASIPANCPAIPSNYTLVKPLDNIYGGWWRPASGAATFVGQIPVGAGMALEFPANTSAYAGGFKVVDSTGGSKSYVISRCPGSTVPVDGQDGTIDKNGDGKKDKCIGQGIYARWVNTSGTIPSYFSGTTYIESLQTSCFLPTTTSLGSSTQATYYINIANTGTAPVGIQYSNYSQLGTLPPPLGTVSTTTQNPNTTSTNSSNSSTSVPGFPWTIQGVSYTNLNDVKTKYPGSCVYINGYYAVMGFGPCVSGTSTN